MYPQHIDTEAPVTVDLALRIDAPAERVWRLHADVDAWPGWQHDITSAHADGPLRPGATFRWETAGMTIDSTVYAVEPGRRILWGGPAHGITGVHSWTFEPDGDGVIVRTEESWDGEPVRADADTLRVVLRDSLRRWLELLKATAERA